MKYKTKLLADRLTGALAQWDGVECVCLNEAALPDTLDPYFALILDVYCRGNIPAAAERAVIFGGLGEGGVAAFETSAGESKDRFLAGNLPVRLEYKPVERIEGLVDIACSRQGALWYIKDAGTYVYYRLAHGEALFSRSGWLAGIRERLEGLGDAFWEEMRSAQVSKMEHFLSDLGAAFFQGDGFNYLVSEAGFMKTACLALFCANRRFEPSHRAYRIQVLALPRLPDAFPALFESMLSNENDMTMERKFKVAQLIARSIVAM